MASVPSGSKAIAWLGRGRRKRSRSCSGGTTSAISVAAAPRPLRRAHLAAADVEELVDEVQRRLAVEDLARDRVGAVAGAAARGEVLAVRLDGDAEQAPLRRPVDVERQLRPAAERRDLAGVAAAGRPADEVGRHAYERPRSASQPVTIVVPILPQVSQITWSGCHSAGWLTLATRGRCRAPRRRGRAPRGSIGPSRPRGRDRSSSSRVGADAQAVEGVDESAARSAARTRRGRRPRGPGHSPAARP